MLFYSVFIFLFSSFIVRFILYSNDIYDFTLFAQISRQRFVKSRNITKILWISFRLIFMWDIWEKAYKVGIYIFIYRHENLKNWFFLPPTLLKKVCLGQKQHSLLKSTSIFLFFFFTSFIRWLNYLENSSI